MWSRWTGVWLGHMDGTGQESGDLRIPSLDLRPCRTGSVSFCNVDFLFLFGDFVFNP